MKITIEYGHVYFGEAPYINDLANLHDGEKSADAYSRELNSGEIASKKTGLSVENLSTSKGHEVKKVVLVDDVAQYASQKAAQHGDDSARWILFRQRILQAAKDLLEPDEVVSEGSLYFAGVSLNARLDSKARQLGQQVNGARIIVGADADGNTQKIKIRGFKGIEVAHWPSCDVLDLAFRLKQAKDADVIITVLPIAYEEQQNRVNALAEFLEDQELSKTSNATLFLDDNGQACKLVVWNDPAQQAQEIFESLEKTLINALTINS